MKRWIVRLTIALTIALAWSQGINAQQTNPPTLPEQHFTEDQLDDRFSQILAKELDTDDVVLSFQAAKGLDGIVRNAAREVVKSNHPDDLALGDKGFKDFATALKLRAREPFVTEIKITAKTIDEVLNGKRNPLASGATWIFRGLCPLFPICK